MMPSLPAFIYQSDGLFLSIRTLSVNKSLWVSFSQRKKSFLPRAFIFMAHLQSFSGVFSSLFNLPAEIPEDSLIQHKLYCSSFPRWLAPVAILCALALPEVTTCCQILDAFLRSPSLWIAHCLISHLFLDVLLVCLLKSLLSKAWTEFSDLICHTLHWNLSKSEHISSVVVQDFGGDNS